MSLGFLLDENVPPKVAEAVSRRCPEIEIPSVYGWQSGVLLGRPDDDVLTTAYSSCLTVITYDQRTIVPLLVASASAGRVHCGVVFIDARSIPPGDIVGIAAAVIRLWDKGGAWDWTNRIAFLRATE